MCNLALGLVLAAALAQEPQTGARAKALGGAGTAFEDDPHSLWLNPAGIAAQPGGISATYQSYSFYLEQGEPVHHTSNKAKINEPVFIPSFLGAVLPVGSPELPQAVGLGLVTPIHLYLPFHGPNPGPLPPPQLQVLDQTFHRVRASYAIDLRLRPLGESGFFNHVALGAALDLASTRIETFSTQNDEPSTHDDHTLSAGAGALFGLYDDGRSFRASFGIAYQGAASYDFGSGYAGPGGSAPFFDWPQQLQAGLALYLLERLPLRVCLEAQWIDWERAAERSRLPGIDGFEPSLSLSAGAEYRVELTGTVGLIPRLGVRSYDAPWKSDSKPSLPAWGDYQLFINTRDERFVIFSIGIGLAWGYKEGTQDSLDIAFEIGGDAPAVAFTYTFQF